MGAALYVASASTACSAAFSTFTTAGSTSVTAQFSSDTRWQKLKPVGVSVVDISPPVVWNYQQYVQPAGFFYDGLFPRQSRHVEISTVLPAQNFLPNKRVRAMMPVLGAPFVTITTPPEQNIQGIGFDGLGFGQSHIDWLNFLVQPAGFFYDGLFPRQSLSTYIVARFADYEPALYSNRVSADFAFFASPKIAYYYAPSAQNSSPYGFNALDFGLHQLSQDRWLGVSGLDALSVGVAELRSNKHFILPNGVLGSAFGQAILKNKNQDIAVTGFNSLVFSTIGKVYNLKQFLNLSTPSRGINAALYGTAYLQGGVKYIDFNSPSRGFNSNIYGTITVVNTKADQFANLNSPSRGMAPPAIPSPNVSPRFLRPNGIVAWQFGNALVQRNPSPLGYISTLYGTAWVSHSPRYLLPANIEAFVSGIARIFDPTQKILLADKGITGGIFGDIAIRNTRRIITVTGLYTQQFSDWLNVESNRRAVLSQGFNAQVFADTTIYNKTPSIAPVGFNSLQIAQPAIGYRNRTVRPSGWYLPKFGTAAFTKTPEFKPIAFNANIFGSTWISNKTRLIYAGLAKDGQQFGGLTTWHYARKVNPSGIKIDAYGSPRIEHGRRLLLANGILNAAYGNAWVSHGKRTLLTSSIAAPNIPIHKVGRTQHIQPLGYVATLFGSRIIPIGQSIYPQGFINPFGLAMVDLWKKHIKPTGFLTIGQEGGQRFGAARLWNLHQYIVQTYDGDNGLVPPKWTGWTGIENRNKTISAIGGHFARVAEPLIYNKARPILPSGLNAVVIGSLMIAERVRYLKPPGMEPPYMGGWATIFNDAAVIAPNGVNAQLFGVADALNTRRYYPRVGNFESLAMGMPMITDRIRTLSFENRYTIAPIYIPLPKVDLYTRYIEEVGRFDDHQIFGTPSLSVHFNKVITRWSHRDLFGEPKLHNVTPELGAYGHNSEEFGNASLRTQWRKLLHLGNETVAWGKAGVAFRDRQFTVTGFTQWNIPTHKVTKTGIPPYYPQYIWLDAVEIDGQLQAGHGIGIDYNQVSIPSVKSNVLQPSGFVATRYGEHHLQSNGILLEYGISMPLFEHGPLVALRNRTISIAQGVGSSIAFGVPRLSPITLYPRSIEWNLNYWNKFGHGHVALRHRVLKIAGLGNESQYGTPKIELKRRYINVNGIQSYRMGFHTIGDGTQAITQYSSSVMSVFGAITLTRNEQLHRTVRPSGFNAFTQSSQRISNLHRNLTPLGFNAERMGTQLSNDKAFMWQGLRVGPLVKGNYGGFENQKFGQAWISLKVRNLAPNGFETFVMQYDYTQFHKRMRVTGQVLPLPQTILTTLGFDHALYGVPNIRPAAHYIRPDGNADQFRKGAF